MSCFGDKSGRFDIFRSGAEIFVNVGQVAAILGVLPHQVVELSRSRELARIQRNGEEYGMAAGDLLEARRRYSDALPRLDPIRVLAADPDSDMGIGLRMMLDEGGHFSTACAESLAEGRNLFKSFAPDVAIVNRRFPDGRGKKLVCWIRTKSTRRTVPVIMMSAVSDFEEEFERELSSVADACLSKPFGKEELIELVSSVLLKQSLARYTM